MYDLTNNQKKRLIEGIRAAWAIPFIDDIEDFIWEAIFAYVKDIPIIDPLTNVRSKHLFDVISERQKIGWSIKAVQHAINLPCEFEVVIQRADIFKKAEQLGFDSLTLDSPTEQLGSALLKHWYDEKVSKDAQFQGIEDKRLCILLKSPDRKTYAYFEEQLVEYHDEDLQWEWTNEAKTGLQARLRKDNLLVFRWYPNQNSSSSGLPCLRMSTPSILSPERLLTSDIVALLLAKLEGKL